MHTRVDGTATFVAVSFLYDGHAVSLCPHSPEMGGRMFAESDRLQEASQKVQIVVNVLLRLL